ncbi:MAG: ankyrin repeat domain-containing protein [Lentisphaeria bacterium]|nr:ankyrin repeat domain-containing protein [Lentisphaeria bacterium]
MMSQDIKNNHDFIDKLNIDLSSCSLDEFSSAARKYLQDAGDEDILDICLLKSAVRGRLDIIKVIYEKFDHPYMGDEECYPNRAGDTPLLLAADQGNFEIVEYLLEHNANPFAVSYHGCNVAINAISSGNVELAKFLIEDCLIAWQGYTWEGTSALQFAITSRSPRMFGYILSLGGLQYNHPRYGGEEGVDDYPLLKEAGRDWKTRHPKWIKMINGKFRKILTNYLEHDCQPVCIAAEQGNLRKVKQLIDSYEYPLVSDALICSACKGGNIEIFHYFINELHLALPEQALAYAVTSANEKLVSELIFEHDQNIYQTNSSGETLLHIAVRDGKLRTEEERFNTKYIIFHDLLEWGRLDPDAVCHSGSVLDFACNRGDMDIVKTLVRHGAKVDSDSLCAAARSGNVELLDFLLDENPDLNIDSQGLNGTTALHEAIKAEAPGAIKFLIAKGARTDIPDHDNMTAGDYARSFNIKLLDLFW